MKQAVYLDYAATTPMNKAVIEEMNRIMLDYFGNPSSIHQFGRKSHFELEEARSIIANSINAKSDEIIFHSGGTEGDNTILLGVARALKEKGQHIITTNVEHSAVLKPLAILEKEGFEITYLPVDESGGITLEQVESVVREDTILVSVMYGNNEVGSINPIADIGEYLADKQALFHTDAVQAFGTEVIDVRKLNVDYLTVSAHKIYGPKGVGFSYLSSNVLAPILIVGGDQEEKKRGGTENLAGICGLAKAVDLLKPEEKEQAKADYKIYQDIILRKLEDAGIDHQVNGDLEYKLAHILNLWIKGIDNQILLSRLDMSGFAVSTGSACSSGTVRASRVLQAMYGEDSLAPAQSIRISFGQGLTCDTIQTFASNLVEQILAIGNK